jgi:predicted metalloendopeptidase
MKTRIARFAAFLFLVPAFATLSHAAPLIQPWGLNLNYVDRTVNPGDDFYAYANGGWLKTAEIPADRSSAGAWLDSQLRTDERLRTIVAELHTRTDLSPEETKLRDLYDAYTDTFQIEANGLKPIQKDLDAIKAAKSPEDIARIMTSPSLRLGGPSWGGTAVGGLFSYRIFADDKHPDRYVLQLRQGSLGLPDRDYYLKEDDKDLASAREAYRQFLAQTLVSLGIAQGEATSRANEVYALERDIAKAEWPNVESRDIDKTYNPMTVKELKALAPEFPWETALGALGVPLKAGGADRTILVREKSAIPALSKLFAATPIPVWRDYLTLHLVHSFADYLPKKFQEADFAFYGTTLSGNTSQLDRGTRGVRILDRRMGEALGKIYVAKYFPPEAKAKVRALVDNLLAAMGEDLQTLDWMSEATRAKAREKLQQFTVKVGYPDHWRDYSTLAIPKGDLVGSIKNANAFEWRRNADRIDKPMDRTEWGMSPPTINAYYEETANEIVFPAGMLQPPHFDLEADDAVNYGAIGGVIGHEISHGFDNTGAKYDGTGLLTNWWTDEDLQKFQERTTALVNQYNEYEPLPGLHLNGRLTLGENIGDLSGVAIAHRAYKISLGGKEAPVLDGLTGDQRFYLAYAQSWRAKTREGATRQRTISNEHSAPEFRVIGVLRNDDGWYKAFPEITPTSKYYLAPEQRIRLW